MIDKLKLKNSRDNYLNFIHSMRIKSDEYSFTAGANSSPYALCFAIFGYNLLNNQSLINNNSDVLSKKLVENLNNKKYEREKKGISIFNDKQYLQLFCFTLSCLKILNKNDLYDFKKEVMQLIPENINDSLEENGVFSCSGGSGNYAMFIGTFLLYARDYLKIPCQNQIDQWISSHLINRNKNFLWGNYNDISHHQFQNGYHQYEILEYLKYDYDKNTIDKMNQIHLIADTKGHFAPWPGGSSCHDYDACFLLSLKSKFNDLDIKLFKLIISDILINQNEDGGFCESHNVRPRTFKNIKLFINHLFANNYLLRKERIYQFLTLQRAKHDKISSHVSNIDRNWNESNLWDSWFRMLTIARLECKVFPDEIRNWGFINFPGIGFFRK